MVLVSFHGEEIQTGKMLNSSKWVMTKYFTMLKFLLSSYALLPTAMVTDVVSPDFSKADILLSPWHRSMSRHQALSYIAPGTSYRRIMTIVFTSSAFFMWIDLTWNPPPWKISKRDPGKEATLVECFYNRTRDPQRFSHVPNLNVSKVCSWY